MDPKAQLTAAYSKNSKHSNYQVLPRALEPILGKSSLKVHTRYERERLNYVLGKIDVKGKTVLDIGGNTGFFTFECVDAGAKKVVHYEGNKEHSDFVGLAAKSIGHQDKIKTVNNYFTFDGTYNEPFDVILLFNVLHHIGDDYGDKELGVKSAKEEIVKELNSLVKNCSTIVFQLGFNWQGNTNLPLFENGTKKEMIDYVKTGVKEFWDITAIGIAERSNSQITYNDLNDRNIEREDSLGEFLNRPIFILERKAALNE